MASDGIDTVSYFQVDNPLVRCVDPAFIGWHLEPRFRDVSSKTVVKAYAEEKLGHFCLRHGRLVVIEYSDLPGRPSRNEKRSRQARSVTGRAASRSTSSTGNSSAGWPAAPRGFRFTGPTRRSPPLTPQGQPVKPDKPKTASSSSRDVRCSDAIPSAKNSVLLRIVETSRAGKSDFSPVKNAEGVDSACDMPRRPAAPVCALVPRGGRAGRDR